MEDGILVRLVREGDGEAWLALRLALWPDASGEEQRTEMAEILEGIEENPVFVAQGVGGALVGLLEVSIHREAPGCRTVRIGYLEGWYVAPEWRRQGVGRRLVEAAESWAIAQGCMEMASDTTADYPLSPAAHAKLGYEEVGREAGEIFFCKELSAR